ncbi:hypothetical protein L345_14266, partial [Ophiophagus hannah]
MQMKVMVKGAFDLLQFVQVLLQVSFHGTAAEVDPEDATGKTVFVTSANQISRITSLLQQFH